MREEGGRRVDWRKKMMETSEGKRVLCVVCTLSTTEPNHGMVESMRTLVRSMSQILKCSEASRFRSLLTFPPLYLFHVPTVPVIASIIYGTPDNMQNIVNKFRYVEYPAEDNRDGDVLVGQSISKEERARAMAALEKKEDTKSKGDDTAAETKKAKWGGLWKA